MMRTMLLVRCSGRSNAHMYKQRVRIHIRTHKTAMKHDEAECVPIKFIMIIVNNLRVHLSFLCVRVSVIAANVLLLEWNC